MAKTRSQKEADVQALTSAVSSARGVVFADFAGLSVKETQELRRRCREAGVSYSVAKKTLLKLAFEQEGVTAINPRELPGNVAVAFGQDDEVSAAKVLHEFAKEHEALSFVGGLMPQGDTWQAMDPKEVTALAKLPSKEELIAKVVGTIAGPLRGLVGVLSGPQRSLVQVINAMSQKS